MPYKKDSHGPVTPTDHRFSDRGLARHRCRHRAATGEPGRPALHYHSNQSAIEQVLAQLPGEGHVACRADLGDSGSALRLWNEAQTLIGDVDVLVNNAGIFIDHPPLSTDFDQWRSTWDRTLSTNLIGPAHLSMLAAQAMSTRAPRSALFGRGRIVNISSRGAFRGEPDAPAYGASKAGLNALGQSLAKALGLFQ